MKNELYADRMGVVGHVPELLLLLSQSQQRWRGPQPDNGPVAATSSVLVGWPEPVVSWRANTWKLPEPQQGVGWGVARDLVANAWWPPQVNQQERWWLPELRWGRQLGWNRPRKFRIARSHLWQSQWTTKVVHNCFYFSFLFLFSRFFSISTKWSDFYFFYLKIK